MAQFEVTLKDYSDELLAEIERRTKAALEAIGQTAERHAKEGAPVGTTRSTGVKSYHGGSLRKSITHKVVGSDVYIGTNVKSPDGAPYSVYVELGTGVYAAEGNGRKTPWRWKDKNGDWHYTRGMKPTHFLRNAISAPKHVSEYKHIIEAEYSGKK